MGCAWGSLCRRRLSAGDARERRQRKHEWASAGVKQLDLVVRSVSGEAVLRHSAATFDTPVASIVKGVCERLDAYQDTVQLLAGAAVLRHDLLLGECVEPPMGGLVELLIVRKQGPAVVPEATSGREIQVLKEPPEPGMDCHFDRGYKFTCLGDFAKKSNVLYVKTSNDDKGTPVRRVMWKLQVRRAPVTVHLNFRSEFHVTRTGVAEWLQEAGWTRSTLRSTISTGIPNGPYVGPVFSKTVDEACTVELMGSNCGEGTYFVFIELPEES